jgi:hypothetical protein
MTIWFIFETALIESAISSAGVYIEILHWTPFHVLKHEGNGLWLQAHAGTLYCLSFCHRNCTFNSNKSPTWCNSFSVYDPDVCLQLNMFREFSRPSSGAQWLQWQPLVYLRIVVKPEAVTAVIELLMMGGKTPETCWAVIKRQDNKLQSCCIRLVIYLNFSMKHGLTNLQFYI